MRNFNFTRKLMLSALLLLGAVMTVQAQSAPAPTAAVDTFKYRFAEGDMTNPAKDNNYFQNWTSPYDDLSMTFTDGCYLYDNGLQYNLPTYIVYPGTWTMTAGKGYRIVGFYANLYNGSSTKCTYTINGGEEQPLNTWAYNAVSLKDQNLDKLTIVIKSATGSSVELYMYNDVDAYKRFYVAVCEGDAATGIKNVETETKEDNKIYDLQGRQVTNPHKGIYIVNGKKRVIK